MRDTVRTDGSRTDVQVTMVSKITEWREIPAEQAVIRLLDEHGGQIYALGLKLCGSPEDAEELVQETFLNAFRKWEQFEGRSSPATWLYTIASRRCQRMRRKKSGEPARMESLSELLPGPAADIPDLATPELDQLDEQLQKEIQVSVEAAIASLPVTFRLPVVLKEIADFSISEIAEILGIKESTVKTRVHRARLLLRKALTDRLPQRWAEHPSHSRRTCLDLLSMKQEALDRGVEFPLPPSELCTRCQSLFRSLDLAHDVCVQLRGGDLPDALRQMVEGRLVGV